VLKRQDGLRRTLARKRRRLSSGERLRALCTSGMQTIIDYEGRTIRLTDERMQHILEHPEMHGMVERIPETLRNPEQVLESVSDSQARLYYRFYVGTAVGDKHLCVVVKLTDNDAFVLTAYLSRGPVEGKRLWPKSD
jgi:hypothetical protein